MTLCEAALRQCPLLAQSGHPTLIRQCPLLGVKRTSIEGGGMSANDPKRTSRNLDTTRRPTGSRCVWETAYTIERCRSQAPRQGGRSFLLVVPENVSELWPRHSSSPGFFLGKRMRAAATSLTRPKKHSPKSFRSPVGIVKKEPCGIHCLHGQREGIDCGSAGYRFQ